MLSEKPKLVIEMDPLKLNRQKRKAVLRAPVFD